MKGSSKVVGWEKEVEDIVEVLDCSLNKNTIFKRNEGIGKTAIVKRLFIRCLLKPFKT